MLSNIRKQPHAEMKSRNKAKSKQQKKKTHKNASSYLSFSPENSANIMSDRREASKSSLPFTLTVKRDEKGWTSFCLTQGSVSEDKSSALLLERQIRLSIELGLKMAAWGDVISKSGIYMLQAATLRARCPLQTNMRLKSSLRSGKKKNPLTLYTKWGKRQHSETHPEHSAFNKVWYKC